MATNRDQFNQVLLQIVRDLLSQAHLRELLTAAEMNIAGHRQELRTVKSRIARARPKKR